MPKQFNKIIASLLIASSVSLIVNASEIKFSDVVKENAHYDAINSLVNRGHINGYGDGTFRPDGILTRGQAAKILANVLNLDTTNKNQVFCDVSSTHEYVGAINALYENKIINGYSDGTFKPNEPLKRGQMAKIIVKAFGLEKSTVIDLPFVDVSSNNEFRFYIQTLLNYSITTGTTATTYSPSEAVKRGQMASFVVRAEDVSSIKEDENPDSPEQSGTEIAKSFIKVSSTIAIDTTELIDIEINDTTVWKASIASTTTEGETGLIITFENDTNSAFDLSHLSNTIRFTWNDTQYIATLNEGTWTLAIAQATVPSNISAEVGAQQVTLTWDLAPNAKVYNVYRSEAANGSYTAIATNISKNQYVDTGLEKGKTYYYKISSKNGRRESSLSSAIKIIANLDQEGPLYTGDYVIISNESADEKSIQSTGAINVHQPQSIQAQMFKKYGVDTLQLGLEAYRENPVLEVPLKDVESSGTCGINDSIKKCGVTPVYKVGDTKSFWLFNEQTERYYQDDAKLLYIGQHAEIWVHGDSITVEQAKQLANEFDNNIYSLVTDNFGAVSDIDNNGRIAILCLDIVDNFGVNGTLSYVSGYFSPADLYTNDLLEVPVSNEMEIFCIDTYPSMGIDKAHLDITKIYDTLAHEFQHLVNAVQERLVEKKKCGMDTWLDEGLAMASEQMYLNRELTKRIDYYNTSTAIKNGRSVLDWNNNEVLANYSLSYLFVQYLKIQANQGDSIFKEIILHTGTEIEAVESIIHKYIDPTMSFNELLTAFRVALVLKADTGIYGFGGIKAFNNLATQVYDGTQLFLNGGGAVIIQTNGGTVEPSSAKGNDIVFTGIYK